MPCSESSSGVPCVHFAASPTSIESPFIEACTTSALTAGTASGRSMCSTSQAAWVASARVSPSSWIACQASIIIDSAWLDIMAADRSPPPAA